MKIDRFENIKSWQVAREIFGAVYALATSSSLGKRFLSQRSDDPFFRLNHAQHHRWL
jgi:hypothetical protein